MTQVTAWGPLASDRSRADAGLALSLAPLALLTIGPGVYFLVLHLPLWTRHLRFTDVAPEALPREFTSWLSIVFRTWAGFLAGLGICPAGCAG